MNPHANKPAFASRQYMAFISYSHADTRIASWIHDAIETYRLPRELAMRLSSSPTPLTRVSPVFLDRADMAAMVDLDAAICDVLAQSRALIVVCSPASAVSARVAREIEHFRSVHSQPRILTMIVGGRPNAIARGLDPAEEAFPAALRSLPVGDTTGGLEPLGADLRPARDSRKGAILKLIAGLLDIPLDELFQRDLARMRRRWTLFGAVASFALVATSALGFYAWQQRNEAIASRAVAQRDAAIARETTDFLVRLFKEVDPAQARGETLLAREVVDRGLDRTRVALRANPALRVRLLHTIGTVYDNLGLYPRAREVLREALATAHDASPPLAKEIPTLQVAIASTLFDSPARQEAESLMREAIAALRADSSRELELMQAEAKLGYALWYWGEADAARKLLSSLETRARARYGRDSELRGDILEDLGRSYIATGEPDRGLEILQESVRIRGQLFGEDYFWYGNSLNNIGFALWHLSRYREAVDHFDRAHTIFLKVLGPEHPWVAISLYGSGGALADDMRLDKAIDRLTRSVALFDRNHMSTSTEGINAVAILGRAYGKREDWSRAIPLLERAEALSREVHGADSRLYAIKEFDLAFFLYRAGRPKQAIGKFRDVLRIENLLEGGNPDRTRLTRQALADALCATGPDPEGFQLVAQSREPAADAPAWSRAIAASIYAGCDPVASHTGDNERTLQAALETVAQGRGNHSTQARDMVRRLANFYSSRGQRSKALATLTLLDGKHALKP